MRQDQGHSLVQLPMKTKGANGTRKVVKRAEAEYTEGRVVISGDGWMEQICKTNHSNRVELSGYI